MLFCSCMTWFHKSTKRQGSSTNCIGAETPEKADGNAGEPDGGNVKVGYRLAPLI